MLPSSWLLQPHLCRTCAFVDNKPCDAEVVYRYYQSHPATNETVGLVFLQLKIAINKALPAL